MTNWAAQAERERKARVKASASPEQAAGVISWLTRRLEAQRLVESGTARAAVDSMLLILRLHSGVEPVDEYHQLVYPFRAKCASESWTCYGDGQDLVQAPCLHVRLLAQPFAGEERFPRLLVVAEHELAATPG